MENTKIVMVVNEAEARSAYEDALQKIGVDYDIAGSFNELQRISMENAYCGLVIDILTLIRSSKEEKTIAYDCINFYPAIRVKWDARNKSMHLTPLEEASAANTETTLSYFIESRCKPFTARSLRKFPRKEVFLSLLLSTDRECAESEWVKTFTANISRGGAFVYTTESFRQGETVWLRFLDMPEPRPVKANVCWQIPWGTCRSVPGIGVMFDSLSEEQQERINKF